MKILTLIPARMGASRFPGKPMARINGKPMIGHVFERASRAKEVNFTAVATCDQEIFDYVESIGGNAVMTSTHHQRASDRCAEALSILEAKHRTQYDIVVMVQGDEPMIHPEMISEAVQPLIKDKNVQVVNLLADIQDETEFRDKNCIKVVCDLQLNAMYFSRQPIPTLANSKSAPIYKQVCVIPFRRDFLLSYLKLEPTPLEIAESVDMMRVLEHGYKVKMVKTKHSTFAVDTLEDLRKVELLLKA